MSVNQSVKSTIEKAKAKRKTLNEKRIEGTLKLKEKIQNTRPQLVKYIESKPKEMMDATVILCYENVLGEVVVAFVKLRSIRYGQFYPLKEIVDGAETNDNILYYKCTSEFDGEKTHFVVLYQPYRDVPKPNGFILSYYAVGQEIVNFIQKYADVYSISFSGKYCFQFKDECFHYSVRKCFK